MFEKFHTGQTSKTQRHLELLRELLSTNSKLMTA